MSADNEIKKEAAAEDVRDVDEETGSLDSVNPDLLSFFDAMDAKSYDGMFIALKRLSGTATQKEMDDIYTVLDMEPVEGDIKEQTAVVADQLKTLRKFDGERLR